MKRGKPGPDERAAADAAFQMRMVNSDRTAPRVKALAELEAELVRCAVLYEKGGQDNEREAVQPREQTVRHVHVDNRGGQAVIAETVHTGGQNGNAVGQSHATGAAGIGAALPSPDAIGWGMPSPGGEGPEAMPDARGQEPWSA